MARPRRNNLTITPHPNGGWRLAGYVMGERIRKKSHSFGELEKIRLDYEKTVNEALEVRVTSRLTRLTEDQLRDAEAAVEIAGARRLVDCVRAAERVLPPTERKPAGDALQEWLHALLSRKRFEVTIAKNRIRVAAFLAHSKVKYVDEITPAMIEGWVFRNREASGYTQLTDAAVLHAWLAFCAKGARRWLASSPFEIDMKDLKGSAKPVGKPRILTPEQCWDLFKAARDHDGGSMLPYVILGTWCFMRHGEVCRTSIEMIRVEGKKPAVDVDPRKRGTPVYRAVDVPENMVAPLRACVMAMRGRLQDAEAAVAAADTPKKKRRAEREAEMARFVHFSKTKWESIRERAGLLQLGKATRHKRRSILKGTLKNLHFKICDIKWFLAILSGKESVNRKKKGTQRAQRGAAATEIFEVFF